MTPSLIVIIVVFLTNFILCLVTAKSDWDSTFHDQDSIPSNDDCGKPGYPAYGSVQITYSSENGANRNFIPTGSNVTYLCDPGYVLFGAQNRTCNENGYWTPTIPLCLPDLALKKYASQSKTTNANYGPQYAVDGLVSSCARISQDSSKQLWIEISLGKLVKIKTVVLTLEENQKRDLTIGVMNSTTRNYIECVKTGTITASTRTPSTFDCKPNIFGDLVRVFENSKQASTLSFCDIKVFAYPDDDTQCVQPDELKKGFPVLSTHKALEYRCDTGYNTVGQTSAVCINGLWNVEPPVCEKITCSVPPKFDTSEVLSFTNSIGGTAAYQCVMGYVLRGNNLLYCSHIGKWIGPEPLCKKVHCGHPPFISNGKFHITMLPDAGDLGSEAELQCNEGFYLKGNDSIVVCQNDSTWTGISSTCDKIKVLPLSTTSVTCTYSLVINIILFLFFTSLFVFGVIYCKRRQQHTKRLNGNYGTDEKYEQLQDLKTGVSFSE